MTSISHTPKTVLAKLIQPLSRCFKQATHKRKCKSLSDRKWIQAGLLRVFSQEPSGRAFLQKLFESGGLEIKRSLFFETLKSKRRLNLCREVSLYVYDMIRTSFGHQDPFAAYRSLDGFDLHAGDGHYHAASVHDTKKSGKKYPVQHFYSIDLRSHALRHLTLADTSGKRKKEHDTRALKRLDIATLRQGAPKKRKVIYVWDRAGIDFLQWYKWKQAGGIYFISREKKNMELLTIADLGYDVNDPINAGIISYELVGCSAGVSIYRVGYICPISGKVFSFVTNCSGIEPGLIAYLYRCRWDIEKIFDQVKNKLSEKKAWGTSPTAKSMQAQFICMAHNLMLKLEGCLLKEGIENKPENRRRQKRLEESIQEMKTRAALLPPHAVTAPRATQRSVKFIRWLRNHLYLNTCWKEAAGSLKRIYAVI